MAHPARKILPHQVPGWVPDGQWFFITINCREQGANQLCQAKTAGAIFEAATHHHESQAWYCKLLLLMPDHLHAVIAFSRRESMKKFVTEWKRYLARTAQINWQRDFFDHRLRNDNELTEKMQYIRMNPVRKGLCERMEEWPWIYEPKNK